MKWIENTEVPKKDGRYAAIIWNPHIPENEPWSTCLEFKHDRWLGLSHCWLKYWLELPELPGTIPPPPPPPPPIRTVNDDRPDSLFRFRFGRKKKGT